MTIYRHPQPGLMAAAFTARELTFDEAAYARSLSAMPPRDLLYEYETVLLAVAEDEHPGMNCQRVTLCRREVARRINQALQ